MRLKGFAAEEDLAVVGRKGMLRRAGREQDVFFPHRRREKRRIDRRDPEPPAFDDPGKIIAEYPEMIGLPEMPDPLFGRHDRRILHRHRKTRLLRDRKDPETVRRQDPPDLGQRLPEIRHMLEDVESQDRIKAPVADLGHAGNIQNEIAIIPQEIRGHITPRFAPDRSGDQGLRRKMKDRFSAEDPAERKNFGRLQRGKEKTVPDLRTASGTKDVAMPCVAQEMAPPPPAEIAFDLGRESKE